MKQTNFRYRVKLTIETTGGDKVGTGVQEIIDAGKTSWLPGGSSVVTRELGDAVVIELAQGPVFLLVRTQINWLLECACRYGRVEPALKAQIAGNWLDSQQQVLAELQSRRAKATLDFLKIPSSRRVLIEDVKQFVAFSDLENPATVKAFSVSELATLFSGARVKEIVFEATTESVTRDIHRRLPWLENIDFNRPDSQSGLGSTQLMYLSGLRV